MISNLYEMIWIGALVLFILGITHKNLTFTGISFVLHIICWAQSIYIEVPWIAVTNATDYATGTQQHDDPAVGASCWIFIVIDLVIFVYYFLGYWKRKRGDEPAMP